MRAIALALAACAITSPVEARAGHPLPRVVAGALVAAIPDTIHDRGVLPDSAGVRAQRRDTTAAETSRFAKPRWVMLRSLVVPGWGQAYNGAWVKAGVIATVEGALIWKVVDDQRVLNRLVRDVDTSDELAVEAYNQRYDAATTKQFLLGVTVLYALVDAYVDANFKNFKIEFETDPALPGGPPPAGGARVGWEWSF